MKNWLLFAGLFGLGATAAASFDLALVLDDSTRAIHRYDGDTGTYLGKIDMPVGTTLRGMALDQANNRVFVGDQFGYHAYNYNTGQLLFSNYNTYPTGLPNGQITYAAPYGLLRSSFGGNVLRGDLAPSATSTFTSSFSGYPTGGGSATVGVGIDGTGEVVVVTESGVISRVTQSSLRESVTLTGTTFSRLKIRGTSLLLARRSSNAILYGSSQNLAGLQSSTTVGVASIQSVAFGHENIRYAVGLNPTNTQQGMVSQFSVNTAGQPIVVTKQFGNGQLVNPIDMAVVIAPEPGTMIALGAGVLALLRRRVMREQ